MLYLDCINFEWVYLINWTLETVGVVEAKHMEIMECVLKLSFLWL